MADEDKLLGWKILPKENTYDCALAALSLDEQEFLQSLSAEFAEYAKSNDVSNYEDAKKCIENLLEKMLEAQNIEVDEEQKKYLTDAAVSHIAGFAPLDKMLCDAQVEEIAVAGLGKPIRVYIRKKGWKNTNAVFCSNEHLVHTINKMARVLGRRITSQSPRINALLPAGHRIHASIPPLSEGELTIRLHAQNAWSVYDIMQAKTTNAHALAFLWMAFQSDSSVLVAGNTASGKTTLLNTLFSFVPANERIVLIEETPEIRLFHEHVVKMICNEDLAVSMPELVRDSLRMRPDRVIAGEIRSKQEVEAFVETLLSGQARGSYATFHAQSANEALRRLCNLGAQAHDVKSLDYVVVQRRLARYDEKKKKQNEIRKMTGIYRVQKEISQDGQAYALPVFEYDEKEDELCKKEYFDTALLSVCSRLGISEKKGKEIYAKRVAFLKRLVGKDTRQIEQKIQEFAYGGIDEGN
ncbi:MAG: ATPase, T2SS/T4P/T4SS family [Candidatus Micrarchaeia archaeon]